MAERKLLTNKTDSESKHKRAEIGNQLSEIRKGCGLSKDDFEKWIAVQQHRYKNYIDSHVAQKIALAVWEATESMLFKKGKTIHFKKFDDLYSLEGKNNEAGLTSKKGKLKWIGLIIQPQIRDQYTREALKSRVKYCRIKRMAMGTTYHHYLELILEGIPPQKITYIKGRAGLDQGTSSEAVFSESGAILTELAPERPKIEREVKNISRRLDRSRRTNNPDN